MVRTGKFNSVLNLIKKIMITFDNFEKDLDFIKEYFLKK